MLGDEEIFSSSVRALLHLSLHSDASRMMRALAPAPTAATLRLNRSGDPLASGRHFAVF
jgi:hypothetical protein